MKPYLKVPLIYFGLGVCWILATDLLAGAVTDDAAFLTQLQMIKGWFFVLLSTVVVYFLTRRAFHQKEADEASKKAVFKKTVSGSCHILLNYLNQMELVTLEAERCEGFDPVLLATARRISEEASEELQRLDQLQFAHADEIEHFVYRKIRAG